MPLSTRFSSTSKERFRGSRKSVGESLALAMASGVRLKVNATAAVSESCSATVADKAVTASPVRDQTGIRLSLAGVGALAFVESEGVDIGVVREGVIQGRGLLTKDVQAAESSPTRKVRIFAMIVASFAGDRRSRAETFFDRSGKTFFDHSAAGATSGVGATGSGAATSAGGSDGSNAAIISAISAALQGSNERPYAVRSISRTQSRVIGSKSSSSIFLRSTSSFFASSTVSLL